MNLDFFKELKNNLSNNNEVKEFINDLAEFMNNLKEEILKPKDIREEGLYYVLDGNPNKVYLTKFNSKKVFEETDIPQEIKNTVSEGFILRYKDGKYIVDEELTEKNFEGILNIEDIIQENNENNQKYDDVYNVLELLGSIHFEKKEFSLAIDYYTAAIESKSKKYGENSIKMATLYNNIGFVYGNYGYKEKALVFLEKSYDLRLLYLGEDNYDTRISKENIEYVKKHIKD